ncbi:energy-coupling factor ABC transporter ATP-binding protein, partial [Bacillus sp. SIMBA_161]
FQRRLEEALGVKYEKPMLTLQDAASEIKVFFQEEKDQ